MAEQVKDSGASFPKEATKESPIWDLGVKGQIAGLYVPISN